MAIVVHEVGVVEAVETDGGVAAVGAAREGKGAGEAGKSSTGQVVVFVGAEGADATTRTLVAVGNLNRT